MNGKIFLFLTLIMCLIFTGNANSQNDCVNPPLDSMKAAYGVKNIEVMCEHTDMHMKDQHRCMADIFIKNAPFPQGSKKLIHTCDDFEKISCVKSTGPFYHDKSYDNALANFSAYPPQCRTGRDTEANVNNTDADGIDTTMLFFHVGHGEESSNASFSTAAHLYLYGQPDHYAHTQFMKLGNCESCNEGMLRYFWQCACQVFAHGPQKTPGHPDYFRPEDYDGSNDNVAMRNVYARWGPALGTGLRMACGVSTLAYCDKDVASAIWTYYREDEKNFDVADAFIMGMHSVRPYEVIPLCIASGGSFKNNSPLIKDTRFTNLPNDEPVPRTNLYIQFPQGFQSNKPYIIIVPPLPPRVADIFRLKIPRRLPPIDRIEFKVPKPPQPDPHIMISTKPDADFGLSVKVRPVSGAVYFSGKLKFDPKTPILSEAAYIDRAAKFMGHFGLSETSADAPSGIRMMLQSTSLESKGKTISHAQKNVIVTFKRHIVVEGKPVTVLGDGGEMQVQMNNDGSIINASKVWREIDGIVKKAPVKPYGEAYKEAIQFLKDSEAYHLTHWTWGYKELSGSVKQEEMRIVYRFYFVPKKQGAPYSPTRIEILAQD